MMGGRGAAKARHLEAQAPYRTVIDNHGPAEWPARKPFRTPLVIELPMARRTGGLENNSLFDLYRWRRLSAVICSHGFRHKYSIAGGLVTARRAPLHPWPQP